MKKVLLTMLGIAGMLCSTSCSDEEIVSNVEGDAMVQFTVELSDGSDASRAISDGTTVNTVYYEVWGTKNNAYQIISDLKDTAVIADKKATVNLALVKGQTYDIVFWASKAGVYNTSDLTNIAVNEGKTNDEEKDAFTAKRTYTVNGPIKETVILRRPFAQINFGTPQSDLNAAKAAGAVIAQSELTVTNVATTYNALTEEGVGEKNYTFAINAIADTVAEDLVVNGAKYEYLATAYVLYQGDSTATATSDLTMRVPTGLNQDVVLTVPTAPVQRNYRTNVLGNLLTNTADFNIVIDNNFKGETNIDEKNPEGKFEADGIIYNITSANTVEVTYKYDDYSTGHNYSGDIIIPESVNYKGHTFIVTKIGDSAFYGSKNMTSITLPNTITELGNFAFYSCYKLESVNIPKGIKQISPFTFMFCTGLTTISIPNSVTEIGEYAFRG